MDKAKRGDWVRIHKIILEPGNRASNLPEETLGVPLEMWVKGILLEEKALLGDDVTVRTVTGRNVRGRLRAICPSYNHSFGSFIPELQAVGDELRRILMEGESVVPTKKL